MTSCDFSKLYPVTLGLNRRFPDGNKPFKMMTRLLKESCTVQVAIYCGICFYVCP